MKDKPDSFEILFEEMIVLEINLILVQILGNE